MMPRIMLIAIFLLNTAFGYSQSYWKIENEYGDEILLSIYLNNENKTFEAYTRKDALKEIAGSITFLVAKTAGKLKYPEIVYISGDFRNERDSTLLTGTFYYFDKQYEFSAAYAGSVFKGRYLDSKNRPKPLIGKKLPDAKPLKNYPSILNTAFATTEKNVIDKSWVKSDEWLDFKKDMLELAPRIADDYELAAALWWTGKKLPFIPFEISKMNPYKKPEQPKATFREVKNNTILFDKQSLPSRQHDMDSLAILIAKKAYANLIIDLRGSRKIDLSAAGILMNFLAPRSYDAGAYVTRKWLDIHSLSTTQQDYKTGLKGISDTGYISGGLHKDQGRYLNVVPGKPAFSGKVYILTDSKTSQTSELLAYWLKKERAATIIGQKTAGSWFLVEHVRIHPEFELVLPVAEFRSPDGKNLNKTAIEPDKTSGNEDAFQFLLKSL